MSPSAPATVLAGRYRIQEHIDSGGVADVWLALDSETHRRVAIKRLKPSLAEASDARERMALEAQLGRRLHHPNVVVHLDDGVDRGLPYLVLELVEGPSLAELVRLRGPLVPMVALELVRQASCGLSVMHGMGLVHRDVKPANLLVVMNGTRPDRVKVADLGFAAERRGAPEEATSVGTLGFMAPEQVLAEPMNAATDVYGLGVSLFFALTGTLPFTGSREQLMAHHLLSKAPPPSWLGPGIGPTLDRIVATALRKHPDNRYPDMTAMRDDLERALCMRSGVPQGSPLRHRPDAYPARTPLGRELTSKLGRLVR
ncbi:MAG: serine/threonine-protein kinase [Polyangiaceae bacterium]